jgi:Holliday junction resolvasome RuvABC endonuclease subunit
VRVVALDLSLTATGVADTLRAPYTISPPDGVRGAARLYVLQSRIRAATTGADLVLLEGYAYGAQGRVFDIGELGGVVRLALYCARIPMAEASPATIKTLATGRGDAPKERVLHAAWKRLGYEGHDHNQADALWLLELALQYHKLSLTELPKDHLRALDKVEWPEVRCDVAV